MLSDPFKVRPHLLPKSNPRFKRWKESLRKRPPPWNKGSTKETHPSLQKISEARRKSDNFLVWREEAKRKGIIKSSYSPLKKNENLSFLIGLVLGDGHIQKFPRTERLIVSLGTDKPDLITFTAEIVEKVFEKAPYVQMVGNVNVARVSLYQKHISSRLEIPPGSKRKLNIILPGWIWRKEEYLIPCLRGLFEAEGSLSIHLPTCTYNFQFSNRNPSLLSEVEKGLRILGFNPEVRPYAIRLRRKKEVKYFEQLINFRDYSAGWSNGSLVAL